MATKQPITLEDVDAAVKYLARGMVEYKKPELRPMLDKLLVERNRLRLEGGALEYASRVLTEYESEKPLPQHPPEKS